MRIAFMRISPAWVGDQFGEKYTDLILLDAWAEQTPLLGKGGVDAPYRNIPVPLKGADGVVRSNSKTICFGTNHPVCAGLGGFAAFFCCPRSAITKCVYFTGIK